MGIAEAAYTRAGRCQYDELSRILVVKRCRRIYRKLRRAEQEAATRQRIIEAAIELHASGPASISAIARRAGVGRVTVYRHFPDERSLAIACTSAVFAERPVPDPTGWATIADPVRRLRHGLMGAVTVLR